MKIPSFKYPFLALIASIFFTACNDISDKAAHTEKVVTAANKAEAWQTPYYKRFEGSIGTEKITVHLMQGEDRTYGGYTVDKDPKWHGLFMMLMPVVHKDSLFFDDIFLGGPAGSTIPEGTWQLEKTDSGKLRGRWMSRDSSSIRPIDLTEVYPAGSFTFAAYGNADSVMLMPSFTNSPMALSKYLIAYPGGAQPAGDWLTMHLKMLMDSSATEKETIGDVVKKQNKVFFDEYMREYSKGEIDTADLDSYFSFSNESSLTVMPRYNQNNLLVIEAMPYLFMGGAHGLANQFFHCYDVTIQKQLKFRDIFTKDTTGLSKLIEKNFRKQYEYPEPQKLDQMLFISDFPYTENIAFNNRYISFLYNPYEIAAYAFGGMEIYVPKEELTKMLQPAFKARMGWQ